MHPTPAVALHTGVIRDVVCRIQSLAVAREEDKGKPGCEHCQPVDITITVVIVVTLTMTTPCRRLS
jgi:hypothetical protein